MEDERREGGNKIGFNRINRNIVAQIKPKQRKLFFILFIIFIHARTSQAIKIMTEFFFLSFGLLLE